MQPTDHQVCVGEVCHKGCCHYHLKEQTHTNSCGALLELSSSSKNDDSHDRSITAVKNAKVHSVAPSANATLRNIRPLDTSDNHQFSPRNYKHSNRHSTSKRHSRSSSVNTESTRSVRNGRAPLSSATHHHNKQQFPTTSSSVQRSSQQNDATAINNGNSKTESPLTDVSYIQSSLDGTDSSKNSSSNHQTEKSASSTDPHLSKEVRILSLFKFTRKICMPFIISIIFN